jgi:hypothetical protein
MAVLPKLHLNRHTGRSILYGPELYGGLNLPHACLLQSIGQIHLLLGHLRAKDKTSKLILISMSHLQLLVGSDIPFFHLPFKKYEKWIEPSWLTSIWKLVSLTKFTVSVRRAWQPTLQRKNDIMLMQFFISLNFNPTQLETLNRCRIYLQVISLSDITSVDGSRIVPTILQGLPLTDRKSTLSWPTQQRPKPSEWALWSTALDHLQHNNSLTKPLTDWISPSHQSWFWYMDPTTSTLFYNPSQDNWLSTQPISLPAPESRRRTRSKSKLSYSKESLHPTSSPEPPLFPASIPQSEVDNISPNTSKYPLHFH